MTSYEIGINSANGEVYVNARFFGFEAGGDIDGLNKYANALRGFNFNYDMGNSMGSEGAMFPFPKGPEKRIVMFLYNIRPETRLVRSLLLASAHARSVKASEKMLDEFVEITGLQETDVDEDVRDFYRDVERRGALKGFLRRVHHET